MTTSNEISVELIHPDNSKSRGLLIQINKSALPLNHPACTVRIIFPNKWQTITHLKLEGDQLHLIVVGHLYAREANKFEVIESLRLLGRIYRSSGTDAMRSAIGGGMFTLFIIDRVKQQVHSFCDLLACMPLFYSTDVNSATLATNQFDLKHHRQLSVDCLEYIIFGYLPFSSSIFDGVQRLGPGQIMTIDLTTRNPIIVTDEQFPIYPPLNDRIQEPATACQELDRLLTRFYSRLGEEPISAGLSGGYDSRLIAAFTQKLRPYLVTFNYPGTSEVETAQQVSNILGNPTHLLEIPADAPTKFMDDFLYGLQALENFGSSHIFSLLDALMRGDPAFIIDGFMGDVILGGGFYYKLFGGTESIIRVMTLNDKYDREKFALEKYISMCLSGYGRAIDLQQVVGKQIRDTVNINNLESFISKQMNCCHSHSDMVELLLYRFRGRRAACGPITFLRRINTICPYYDTDVLTTCMSLDKSLRAGDRFYNAFWRYRFPELANIPKERTGSRASQTDLGYRLTHVRNALLRRLASHLPASIMPKSGGDLDDFETRYCELPANREFFAKVLENARPRFREAGIDSFLEPRNTSKLTKQLYLRLVSLAALLVDS